MEQQDNISLKEHYDLIRKELGKYSWKVKRDFEKFFPCKKPTHRIEIFPKEYIDEQNMIKVKMKLAELRKESWKIIPEQYSSEYIFIESSEDFWRRWNRFKKMLIVSKL